MNILRDAGVSADQTARVKKQFNKVVKETLAELRKLQIDQREELKLALPESWREQLDLLHDDAGG